MARRRYPIIFVLFLISILSLGFAAALCIPVIPTPASAAWNGDFAAGWKEFHRLAGEQKHEAAASLAEAMLEKARSAHNSSEWTRCLIRIAQTRIALHAYEKAAHFLKSQPWPQDTLESSVLHLYYAQTLVTYARSHSWEINTRERMDTKGVIDLKTWTRDQVYEEAQKALANVWQIRSRLGELPNTEWKEYLEPNTYPTRIRPTLRDAVSYLCGEMLADTNGWQPAQLNEIYRLDLPALIAGTHKNHSFADPARHPLEKISFILTDLENWHLQKNNREAALEARLERCRQLHQRFSNPEDREHIRRDLENHLRGFTKYPWWSEGMAQLAELIRQENDPDSLIRARQLAIQGRTAFPESIGGQHCAAIEKAIEAPDYTLSAAANDNPQKKSILIKHKNLSKIHFRAYAIDLIKTIETSKDYTLFPAGRDLEQLLADNSPVSQWEAPLPATLDYRSHRTFVTPPMARAGTYLIVASARPDFYHTDNRLMGTYLTLGDLALITRQEKDALEVTVLSGSTGEPVAGAEVLLYRLDYGIGHQRLDSRQSDNKGIVSFSTHNRNFQGLLLVRKEKQIAFARQFFGAYSGQNLPDGGLRTLIFTDRSVYRPNQRIQWKAVFYRQRPDKTGFDTAPGAFATVSLRDANNQVVQSETLTTNSFGTASGEFRIPSGRALGQWNLGSRSGTAYIKVEEYKRPTFEARILDPAEPLRLNREVRLKGEARYYFGLPVTNGKVQWLVRRVPALPWWWNPEERNRMPGSQAIASGTESLDAAGAFTISFSPRMDTRLENDKEVTYRYAISADITDEGGETRSAQRSFRIGFVSIEASADQDRAFFLEKDPIRIGIRRASLDGLPRAGRGKWGIAALKNPADTPLPAEQPLSHSAPNAAEDKFRTPGDRERPRWQHSYNPKTVMQSWRTGTVLASGALTHDESGKGVVQTPRLVPGAYRLLYETLDDFGTKSTLQQDFIVAASSLPLALPAVFWPEKASVAVGDTARILAHSGFQKQPMLLKVYRDGACILRKELRSGIDPSLIEIPITEEDRGGIAATLTLLRDNQLIQIQSSVMVPWDDRQLTLEFASFRDRIRPGSKEKWSVKVAAPMGKDMAVPAAELLAYMYDRSLDTFAPHAPQEPWTLYPYRTQVGSLGHNLGPANLVPIHSEGFAPIISPPFLLKDQLQLNSGYGIGGLGRTSAYVNGIVGGIAGGVPGGVVEGLASVAAAPPPPKPVRREALVLETNDPDSGFVAELRSNFSETAFWYPHLLTGADGSVSFEFMVPDSVTAWNVWIHAITRDLKSGSAHREAQSVKDLMVRPYLPRFLREGDQVEIKVVVNNASDKELSGSLNFDIIDVATEQSLLPQFGLSESEAAGKSFMVPANGGTSLTFPIKTPSRVGQIAFKVTATSGDFSDGELRPIPILPGRMHLMQSRFATLKDQSLRTMRFEDLARNDDPTRIHEQMVVTLDAQLFYSVLSALPYLVNYPYECTEQTLNRFLATGILSSLYRQYPAIDRMAKEFSSRQTQYEQWDAADPNRKMALEETPWLQMAQGGSAKDSDLLRVLDSRIAKAQQESALAQLKKSQTSSGGFPWFPGGPPSPYMTLYLLNGFSKALEFGVPVPIEMVKPAWNYLHQHYLDDVVRDMVKNDSGWEFVTFINYVLSGYPDSSWHKDAFTADERAAMLDFSFKHWKAHSPYLKAYLALTLKRMQRPKEAVLVWESVLDSARTAEDQGTFWAPEDRGWLWYNDTIESHAFAIRADMELLPQDPKLDGMVQWLFLNRKMNHWKSTQATAEVIYALAHYLKASGQMGRREEASVTIGQRKTSFVFEPDQYTGKKNQIVLAGDTLDPAAASSITIEKTSKGHLFASATWHFSTERLPEEERGDYVRLSRKFFKRVRRGEGFVLQPLAEEASVAPGDEVEVHLSIASKHPMEYVHLRDPRGAGFEPTTNRSRHKWEFGIGWYEEIRDSGTNFFFERIPQGEYTFKYRLRATTEGVFRVAPATVQPMYAPEFAAYSAGATLIVGTDHGKSLR